MEKQARDNSGVLFKNDKKETEKHPDYKGSLTTPDGVECWVSAWIKRPEGKATYMSLSIQAKDIQPATVVEQSTPATSQPQKAVPIGKQDGLPF